MCRAFILKVSGEDATCPGDIVSCRIMLACNQNFISTSPNSLKFPHFTLTACARWEAKSIQSKLYIHSQLPNATRTIGFWAYQVVLSYQVVPRQWDTIVSKACLQVVNRWITFGATMGHPNHRLCIRIAIKGTRKWPRDSLVARGSLVASSSSSPPSKRIVIVKTCCLRPWTCPTHATFLRQHFKLCSSTTAGSQLMDQIGPAYICSSPSCAMWSRYMSGSINVKQSRDLHGLESRLRLVSLLIRFYPNDHFRRQWPFLLLWTCLKAIFKKCAKACSHCGLYKLYIVPW